MSKKIDLSIVFPAYDEEKNIERAVKEAMKFAKGFKEYEIIVVDDGSRDDTKKVVLQLVAQDKRVKGVFHRKNQGYGSAVWDGLKKAQGELVFFTDSDLQFKLSDLAILIKKLDGFDAVVGYRKKRIEGFRRTLNVFLWQTNLRIFLGLKLKDIDCAFKLFKKNTLKGLRIESGGAMFSAELMFRIKQKGLRIIEVPVDHFERKFGRPTGSNIWVIIRALKEFARFYGKVRRERKTA